MPTYLVGEPFPIKVPEGSHLEYDVASDMFILLLSMPEPTHGEVHGVRKGAFSFRLLASDVGMLVLFKFEPGLPWCDASFEWRLLQDRKGARVPDQDASRPLYIFLIDSNSNTIKAIRVIGLQKEWAVQINRAVRLQALRDPSPTEQEATRWLSAMRRYSPGELARLASGELDMAQGSEAMVRLAFTVAAQKKKWRA